MLAALGIKPGRFLPGTLHREVLTGQLGFTDESVREWLKRKRPREGWETRLWGGTAQLGSKRGADRQTPIPKTQNPKPQNSNPVPKTPKPENPKPLNPKTLSPNNLKP